LKGVAVKITVEPAHTGFAEGAMETVAGAFWFTLITTVFELDGFPVAQLMLDVTRQ
jgi:hypothetical protein